ncbi:hypothetical protein [Dietzia sp. 179-F 9C3 NHS]|uniref:hypothetical protein n=1 Tax=Dietzia sp. 179-F 9C3 NHS TaxID=3374295 RepID=UPI003879F1DD
MNHLDALTALVARLYEAGVDADLEPRNLRPPCAWVSPRTLDPGDTLGGSSIEVDLYLIAPDTGTRPAHDHLTEMLDKAMTAAGPDPGTTVALDQAVTLSTGGPLPAYRYTTTVTYC